MTDARDLLQPLFNRPDLPELAEIINRRLHDERAARERFRSDVSPSVKAEFISGEVIQHSPASARHLRTVGRLFKLLDTEAKLGGLGEVFAEKALISLTRNDYEPDIAYFSKEKSKYFTANQMVFPAPDLVVEVLSDSTAERDRGIKFVDYAAHGVREYWIVDCHEEFVEQYVLREGKAEFDLVKRITEGTVHIIALNGLTIPVRALFDDAVNAEVLAALYRHHSADA